MFNDDLYEDEVMRDCWERKAQLSAEMADWDAYTKRQRETPLLTSAGKPWPMAKPEDLAAMMARNKPPSVRAEM
jgi:hypothetical protein